MKHVVCKTLLLLVIIFSTAHAQEGHPLNGTWRGQWGTPGGDMNHLVIVMSWDSHGIGGIVNPGRNSVEFETAALDPETWEVDFAVTLRTGEKVRIHGLLENIGSYNRTITGTWLQDGDEYSMNLTRE